MTPQALFPTHFPRALLSGAQIVDFRLHAARFGAIHAVI
jgi:hypothetical protein